MNERLYFLEFNQNRIDTVPDSEVVNHNYNDLPQRDIKVHKIARRDLSIITSSEYTVKQLTVSIDIKTRCREDTEIVIRNLKALLQAQNGLLKIWNAGIKLRYTATLNEFNINWQGGMALCEVVFLASTPIGEADEADILFTINGITTSTASKAFTVEGSFMVEPVIVLSFKAASTGSFTLVNGSTQQGITITGTFANGDTVTIDSKEYSVQHNGAEVDFTGAFPIFPVGAQVISYSDTFASRNIDISSDYRQRIV